MCRWSMAMAIVTAAAVGFACELHETPPHGYVAPDPVRDDSHVEHPREFEPTTASPSADDVTPDDVTDEVITQQIRSALAENEWLSWDARQIDVSTSDGVVMLRGRVETEDERYIVKDIAWETEGVREVVDEIEVRGPSE